MLSDILKDVDSKLDQTLNALSKEFDGIRAGRANPLAIENISVTYYGAPTILKSLGNILVSSARSLQFAPYDKSQIKSIEKELIENQAVEGSISSDGNSIYITLPELTTETRQEYVKLAAQNLEDSKVSARTIRHNAYKQIGDFKSNSSEDDIKRAEKEVDSKLNNFSKRADELFKKKESQILGD
jgi:ribosome recycling factor